MQDEYFITMKTAALISACLIAIGLACAIAFHLIGSTIDANGLLHEPFALIPIGYLFFAAGLLTGLGAAVQFYWQRFSN